MIWQSFFLGATAMLFVFLLAFFLFRARMNQLESDYRERLWNLWERRLKQGAERNAALQEIRDALYCIAFP